MSVRLGIGLIIIATTIWVGFDAHALGVKRGKLRGGPLDMSVTSWVICCLFLWIVSFPCYLVARFKYQEIRRRPTLYPGQPGYGWPPQPYVNPPAAPPISPDGQWWWDGQRWLPMSLPTSSGLPGTV